MAIEKGKDYITLVEVKGIAPKGTKVKPWMVDDGKTNKRGESGETYGFNLTGGGGFFLKEDEVELAS